MEGPGSEPALVYLAARRRGGGMAARGAAQQPVPIIAHPTDSRCEDFCLPPSLVLEVEWRTRLHKIALLDRSQPVTTKRLSAASALAVAHAPPPAMPPYHRVA